MNFTTNKTKYIVRHRWTCPFDREENGSEYIEGVRGNPPSTLNHFNSIQWDSPTTSQGKNDMIFYHVFNTGLEMMKFVQKERRKFDEIWGGYSFPDKPTFNFIFHYDGVLSIQHSHPQTKGDN